MLGDTIAAIATPPGEGGIGIVRVSGTEALKIAEKIFQSAYSADWQKKGSHRLFYGRVIEPDSRRVVDEVLMGVMLAPHTYTREDVVEFNCHGGMAALRRVLELVLAAGARLAEPGEFTRRAFLNGRLDLAQAESIIDLIRARTDAGRQVAVSQLTGRLSRRINDLQNRLLGILARLEASIDFPEEDVDFVSAGDLSADVAALSGDVMHLIEQAGTGRVYREGVSTAIIGRPNVGKSSLLNALLQENRAIVTDIPGTTRDVIEEILNLHGIPLKLADTAGLRATDDLVEKLGVERTQSLIEQADVVLVILDTIAGFTDQDKEILDMVKAKKGLILVNKCDAGDAAALAKRLAEMSADKPVLTISARYGTGLNDLIDAVSTLVLGGGVDRTDDLLISNVRHIRALNTCLEHLREVERSLRAGTPVDLLAIDLRSAWEALGEITGTTVSEEIIDRIFSDFCIGK